MLSKNIFKKFKISFLIFVGFICIGITSQAINVRADSAVLNEYVNISFDVPTGWFQNSAIVKIKTQPINCKIETLKAKIGDKGSWQDIKNNPEISILQNGIVYVEVSYLGNDTKTISTETQSQHILCIDNTPPTVRAKFVNGSLVVNAEDSISKVSSITINNKIYSIIDNQSLSINNNDFSTDEMLEIKATDNAGNTSQVLEIKNQSYIEPSPVVTVEPTVAQTQTPVVTVEPTVVPTQTPVVTVKPTVVPIQRPVATVKPTVVPIQRPVATAKPTVVPIQTPVATVASVTSKDVASIKNQTATIVNSTDVTPQSNSVQAVSADPNITTYGATTTPISATPPPGQGTVIESATKTPLERDFYTIKTDNGTVFYLIVDKQANGDDGNVHFLKGIDATDLSKMVDSEKNKNKNTTSSSDTNPLSSIPSATTNINSGIGSNTKPNNNPFGQNAVSAFSQQNTNETVSSTPSPSPTDSKVSDVKNKTVKKDNTTGILVLLFIVIGVIFGGYFYLNIYKKKQNGGNNYDNAEDFEEMPFIEDDKYDKENVHQNDEYLDVDEDEDEEYKDDAE